MFSTTDTIVAIATPPGRGGIGVVRVSGSQALAVARALLEGAPELRPRQATLARVAGKRVPDEAISHERRAGAAQWVRDEVVVTFFPGPASYTGEDVVELSAHGSPVVLEGLVQEAIRAGARLAGRGEFTLRAFLHGRIDLVQAEAVADLIEAVTPLQARAAFDQLSGTLTEAISELEAELFDLIVALEASIDFPEEGYRFIEVAACRARLESLEAALGRLVAQAGRGRLIREGRQLVIVGAPNTGKSSLFNCLVGAERAIVAETPGTTRDLVSETCALGGVAVTLVDTAGLGEPFDAVEREGVRRAVRAADVAGGLLVVLDRSRPLGEADSAVLERSRQRDRLVVVNKIDRPACWALADLGADGEGAVAVSLLTGAGVDELRAAVARLAAGGWLDEEAPVVTNVRHAALLERARAAVGRAADAAGRGGREALSEEFVLADLREAQEALEEVTGKRTSDAVLEAIFSRFCVGK